MLRFRRQDELEISSTKYTSKLGLQISRHVELPPFNILLDGDSNTVDSIILFKLDVSGYTLKTTKIPNGIISYNSTYDLIFNNGLEFGELEPGHYKLKIKTPDDLYVSEIFKICKINIPKILLQVGGEDDVLESYPYIENGGYNDDLINKNIVSNGGNDRI